MFTKTITMNPGRQVRLFVYRHLYAILLVIFSVVLIYQTFYTTHVLNVLRSITSISRMPFAYSPSRVVTGRMPEAAAAGLKQGDRVEEIKDKAFSGDRVLLNALATTKPGQKLSVVVTGADGARRNLDIVLAPLRDKPAGFRSWIFSLTSYVFMPIFCLLLGLAVAAMRPAKLITWIVLALMMSLTCLEVLPGWNGPFYAGALFYQDLAQSSFGIWLVLFGIYFSPEHNSKVHAKAWIKWLLIGPLAIVGLLIASLDAGNYSNFQRLEWLHGWAGSLQTAMLLLNVAAVLVFIGILLLKSLRATTHDLRRRLMILWVGTGLSFGPLAVLVIINLIRGEAVFENMPAWAVFPAILMLTLFPLTLAYVILAHRALALRVIAREALKQAFTPGGAVILRLLVLAVCFVAVAYTNTQPWATRMDVGRVIFLAAVFACFAQLPFAERLQHWFDRRVFRNAYHSEKILRNLHSDIFRDNASLIRAVRRRVQRSLRATQVTLFLGSNGGYRITTSVAAEGVPQTVGALEGIANRLIRINRPILAYFDDPHSWVHELPREEQQVLRQVNTQLLLPLTRNRDLIGFLSLGPKKWDEAYSGSDLQVLLSLATQLSFALENIRLLEQLANEAVETERRIAEKQAAEQANQAKSAFLARMSHELRTPLNAIIGYSEMLQEEAADLDQPAFVADLEKIRSAGRHLLELINSILDISKIEAGRMELHLQNIQLREVTNEVVTMVKPVVEKNRNRLQLELCEFGEIQTDVTKLRQSLVNLLSNAGKFTENGVVTLAVNHLRRNGADWLQFQVRDTGIGITREQLARLFQPFTQADPSVTRKYGGTGLGLVITRRFCQMLGGEVRVTSEFSKGSVFTIELPARVNKLVNEPAPEAVAAPA